MSVLDTHQKVLPLELELPLKSFLLPDPSDFVITIIEIRERIGTREKVQTIGSFLRDYVENSKVILSSIVFLYIEVPLPPEKPFGFCLLRFPMRGFLSLTIPLGVRTVTPRPERMYSMCNRMCTKGFLNYFSAIIEFLKVVLRVELESFQRIVGLLQLRKVEG